MTYGCSSFVSRIRWAAPALAFPFLSGCDLVVLDPAGYVAEQQRNIILISTGLMLLIIVPVMILTVVFAWRYRSTNTDATYDPEFDHSTALELVIWSAPLMIIITLGALTWWSTHLLDPFRPLAKVALNQPAAANVKPLRVEVVSLDWKWLFIYPDEGIATVNELALPVGVPVRFDMTSTNMMNTFDVPTMAGMIYTMPGMRSTLHAVLNRPVESIGLSGNYSGAGFSDMTFKVHGLRPADYRKWVANVKASPLQLSYANYGKLVRPSQKVPPIHFSSVEPDMFRRIYERCIDPGQVCMSTMMRMDQAHAAGAWGKAARVPATAENLQPTSKGALLRSPTRKGSGTRRAEPEGSRPAGAKRPSDASNRNTSSTMKMPAAVGAPERSNA